MFVKKAALAAIALSLAAAPVQAPAKEAEAVKVQSKGAFKGASRIAIAAFNVGFILESTDQTKLRSDVKHFAFSPDGNYLLAQDDFAITVIRREP